MGIYTSPTALRQAQAARFQRIGVSQKRIHHELAQGGRRDFLMSTVGRVSSKQLAKLGHPYGRLGGSGGGRGVKPGVKVVGAIKGQVSRKGVLNPLPINKQSGKLHRAIRLQGPDGPKQEYRLASYAPHAKYVLSPTGTKKMVARGLLGPTGLLRKRHKARMAGAVDAWRQANRSN